MKLLRYCLLTVMSILLITVNSMATDFNQEKEYNNSPFLKFYGNEDGNLTANGDNNNVGLSGRWANGPSKAVTISGTDAFIGNGGYLVIIDVSTPASPSETGKIALPEPMHNIVVSGNYAYIADGKSGLRIIDISAPANPTEVGFYNTDGTAYDVVFSADTVYIADGEGGLKVIDVSDKANPDQVGLYQTGGIARSIAFFTYSTVKQVLVAFYSNNEVSTDDGIRVFDVSDVSNISQTANIFSTDGNTLDIEVVISGPDTLAFIANADSGLVILDASDPTGLVEVGSYDTTGSALAVNYFANASDTLVLIANADDGLLIVDVSDHTNPVRENDYIAPGGYSYGISSSTTDDHAYLADGLKGLQIIDISTPATPALDANFLTGGTVRDVASAIIGASTDTLTFIADPDSGLRILDVTDPANISQIGFFDSNGTPYGVDVLDDYVYLADGVQGLRVIDISDPTNPVEQGFYDTDEAHAVVVSDTIAYVADYNGGLRIIDISNPANPNQVGLYDPTNFVRDVDVSGNYAYIAIGYIGMRVIDVSDPSSPTLVASYNSGGESFGIAVLGNYAYIADGSNGLRIVDISTPSSPSPVTIVSTEGSAQNVEVAGNYAYVADGTGGLRLINISDPATAEEVGYYDSGDFGYNVSVLGHTVYLADDEDGLYVLDNTLAYTTHFTVVAPTGKSIPVVIQNATINGVSVEAGDELAIFDGDTCVGATTYRGISPFNITVWMRYIYESDTLKGAVPGDKMIFKIWDKSEDDTLGAYPYFTTGDGTFSETQMLTVVSLLEAYKYDNFSPVDPTGNSQMVKIYNVTINDDPIEIGDEIGIFDDDLCVGVHPYEGSYPIQIPVWLEQTLPNNNILPGAHLDHSMSYKVWHDNTQYLAEATYDASSTGNFGEITTIVEYLKAVTSSIQRIAITSSKLNLISFNVWPIDSLDRRIGVLLDDIGSLLVCQDDEGNFFLPGVDTLNTIESVNFDRGYQVFYEASTNDTIINEGFILKPDTMNISLTPRFYMIGYPYQIGHDVSVVFATIKFSVVIVQDDDGNFWIPDYNVNDINDMVPGKGYKIYVDQNVSFTFPNLPNGLGKSTRLAEKGIKDTEKKKHFKYQESGIPHAVLITGSDGKLMEGDEIGVFAGDLCVGSKEYTGEFPIAVAAWEGVHYKSLNIPGFKKGQDISIRIWNESENNEYNVPIDVKQSTNTKYDENPFSLISLGAFNRPDMLPETFGLEQNYPNPFNPETTIRYQVPKDCRVSLIVYNTIGQKIRMLVDENKQQGRYTVKWNGYDNKGVKVGSGIYFIRMKAGSVVKIRKMMLVQ